MDEQYQIVDAAIAEFEKINWDALTEKQQEKYIAIHSAMMTFSHQLEHKED